MTTYPTPSNKKAPAITHRDYLDHRRAAVRQRLSVTGGTAAEGYVYVQGINLSKGNPTATIEFDIKGQSGVRKVSRVVSEGYSLFDNSGELAKYKDGYTVLRIDGRDSSVNFVNGKKLFAGDVIGSVSEVQLRRIQIRETILSHIERERALFTKGIKVLSPCLIPFAIPTPISRRTSARTRSRSRSTKANSIARRFRHCGRVSTTAVIISWALTRMNWSKKRSRN